MRGSRQFRLLVSARVVSFAGDQLTVVALTLLVHSRYGAGTAVSALLVAHVLPHLFGPVMGTVVDRADQRTVLRVCESLRVVLVGTIVLTLPALPILVVLVAANATVATTLRPAGRSAIPVLVERHQLAAANATLATGANLGLAIGPVAGGALVAWVGVSGALLVDVATSAGAVLALGFLRPIPPAPGQATERRLLAQTRAGLAYCWREPVTRVLAVALFLGVSLAGTVIVGGVFLVRDTLGGGAAAYGGFAGAWGAGMVAVSVVLALRRRGTSAAWWLVLGFAAQAGALCGAGLAPHLAVAVAAAVAGGVGNGLEDVATDTILQQTVPRELLGRAVGVVYAGSFAGELVAYGAGGPLLDLVGPRTLFVAGGCALVLVTIWVAVSMRPWSDSVDGTEAGGEG